MDKGCVLKYRLVVEGDTEVESVYMMVDNACVDVDFFDAQGRGYVLMCEHEL